MVEKIIKGLIKNTPLTLVVIGLFLVVLGATGGFQKLGIKVEDARWRIVLAVMGGVVAGFGVLVILRGHGDVETSALAKECDLKITSPKYNSDVDQKIRLEGTYRKKPPEKSLAVIELSPTSGKHYFKTQPPLFNEKEGQWWFTDIYIGGDPGKERILFLVILGEAGKALREFYVAVREETGKTVGVKTLTPDVVQCDQVNVHRK